MFRESSEPRVDAENNVYVYQLPDKIVWLIGNEIPEKTRDHLPLAYKRAR